MSFLSSLPLVGKIFDSVAGHLTVNKDKLIEGQSNVNQAEVAGAPASRLRLWRSFLGWILAICYVWEAVARPVIETYWPEAVLPPSTIEITSRILLGMLGLGF